MFAMTTDFVQCRRFGVGRRIFTYRTLLSQLTKLDNPDLKALIEEALAHDENVTQALNARWAAQQTKREPAPALSPKGREADAALDHCITGIDRALANAARLWGEASPEARDAAKLRALFFPAGVREISASTWEQEVAETLRIVRTANHAEWQPLVARLGMTAAVQRLGSVSAELEAVLTRDPVGVLFSEVRAARERGLGYLSAVIAKCLGDYARPNPENEAVRKQLLAPVLEQNRKVASYNRRKRAVPDVDPSTGEEVTPEPQLDATG